MDDTSAIGTNRSVYHRLGWEIEADDGGVLIGMQIDKGDQRSSFASDHLEAPPLLAVSQHRRPGDRGDEPGDFQDVIVGPVEYVQVDAVALRRRLSPRKRPEGPLGGAVDRLAIDVEPAPDRQQTVDHDQRDGAIIVGADVEKQIPALGDEVDQRVDAAGAARVDVVVLGAVEGEGVADAATLLEGAYLVHPLAGGIAEIAVFGGRVITDLAAQALAPAIVDGDILGVFYILVDPLEDLGRAPQGIGVIPLAIGPENIGLVALDQLLDLRDHLGLDVFLLVAVVEGVVPLHEGVVEPGTDSLLATGGEQFAEKVSLWPDLHAVPRIAAHLAGGRVRPQAEAIVMLAGDHHVAGTGAAKNTRPFGGVPQFRPETGGKI